MSLIRSISGLRGTLEEGLSPRVIMDYCSAFARVLPEGPVAVGCDGRPSGKWIENIVAGALAACGREVKLLGIVPTPTVQLFVEHSDCAGGIIVTASHNPAEWNGLKFIGADGVFLDADANALLWENVDKRDFNCSEDFSDQLIKLVPNALEDHVCRIMQFLEKRDLVGKIKARKLTAVIDAVNASGSEAVPMLLRKLGVNPVLLYCDGTGIFPHTPEPLPINLTDLEKAVKENNADLGIAVDPDADRLVLIDNNGNPIGEEMTIALSIRSALESAGEGEFSCVVNHSTSRMSDDAAEMFGAKMYRSAVGEINVIKEMKRRGAIIGGEGSGGVILPECHYGRDSLVGIALVLSLMARSGKTLSELAGEFPKYGMVKLKKTFSGQLDDLLPEIEKRFAGAEIIREDGIKIITGKSWVQLRKSNTEPIIRAIAEAESMEKAMQMAEEMLGLV